MAGKIKFIGVDFGAKMAGTTAICYEEDSTLSIIQSQKKKDADKFLTEFIESYKPKKVFIDAPLSLPGVYTEPGKYNDYFYRKCDREAGAMSPMFIGGLTARAIKLRDTFPNIDFFETYPKLTSIRLFGNNYKKFNIEELIKKIEESGIAIGTNINNFHQIDSILAWIAGNDYLKGIHNIIGNDEGKIYF